MKLDIEIDNELASRHLTFRTRLAILILLLIFRILYPAKYSHQVNQVFEPILNYLLKPDA